MPGLHFESSIDFETLDRQLKVMETKISGLARSTEKAGDDMDATFRRVGTAVGAYFSFQAMSGFAMQVANVRGEFQQLEVAFETMLQSKEKADKVMAEVVKLAAATPFSLTELGQGSKMLLAFKEPADQVANTLKRMGDLAAGASVPIGDLIRAYGKVSAKGKMQAEELNQFAERGIPIISELAKVVGRTDEEIYKMAEQGEIGFAELQQAIRNMTDEGGMFFNLMEKQSKTITGLISNLGDAWDRMMNQIGENNDGLISGSIEGLIELVENYEQVLDILKVIAVTYGTYKVATIAATVATNGLTIAESLHYAALVIAEKAQKLLNRTMLANPYVALATLLAGIVTSLSLFGKKAKEVSLAQEAMARVSEKVNDSFSKQKSEIELLLGTVRNQELSDKQRIKAIEKLKDIIPEYNAELSEEGRLINENTAAIEAYLKQLEIKIKMTAVQDEMAELWRKEREQLKLLQKAQAEFNSIQARNAIYSGDGIVRGGEAGIAGRSSMADGVSRAKRLKEQAEANLEATRNAIGELKTEYKSAEKSLADFFRTGGGDDGKTIKSIEDLKNELSSLENAYNKATDINDKAELGRLAKLIISKRQEIEKFKIESQKSDKRTDIEIFEDELKQKKELFAQYEAYKKVVGEAEANEMYANLREQGASYTSYLHTLLNTLPAGAKKAIVASEIVSTDRNTDNTKDLAELLTRTATFNQQLIALDKKYQKEKSLLEKEGADENLRILTANYEQERQALIESNRLKSDSYKWVYEDINRMNRKALRDYIQMLKEEVKAKKWSDEAKLMLSEKLAQAEQKLADKLPESFSEVGNVLREAASLAGELDENLARAISTAAELAEAASNIALGLASSNPFQVAGGILQAVTSLIKYFSSSEKLRKETEELTESLSEMNEQLDRQARLLDGLGGVDKLEAYIRMLGDLEEQAESTKDQLFDMVRAMANGPANVQTDNKFLSWWNKFTSPAYHEENKDFQKALTDAKLEVGNIDNWTDDDWIRLIGQASGETKKQLEALYDQWVELKGQQEEYFHQWAEYATGMSFDSFTNEFLEALQAGERSAADFADNVEDMLRNAVIQGFKTKYLIEALEPWYKQFAEYSEDGLSAEEVAALREALQTVFGQAAEAFEAMGDLGIDLSGAADSANSLKGAFKGLSEETGSILAGRLNAMHLTVNEHLRVAQRAVMHNAETASNTRELLVMRGILNDIRTALRKGNDDSLINSKRAGGR
jgi:tape measure domain-containing protein